ncbi:MAG TPA: hypothetical protein VHE99_08525 [Gammaproteobacteria bacterium]|nr:hypothetical protein [Gammaproteobacteria bacterium]
MFSQAVAGALARVYVPNSEDGTVSVIDPATYQVVDTFATGKNPQHVVPSYDLKTLWVLNDEGNSVTPINPNTAKPGPALPVHDPYNLYFTPDGSFAIAVNEDAKTLDYRDPQTMALVDSVPVKCGGVNHMDFTVDGRYAIVTCEFSGQLLKLDVKARKVVGYLDLGKGSMPQDARASPNGRVFYIADMMRDGIFLIDPVAFKVIDFIPTGVGTHSVYPSRNSGHLFYIANRGCHLHSVTCPAHGPGSISVLDPRTEMIVANWPIPGGGSPDMGNVSADGKELWLSGRYDSEVYVFNTETGQLIHRIPVGKGPHGLAVWPQPGRYSLGHTGNMR